MKTSNRFNFESKQKMKKMIELSSKEGIEYFTVIKKDYTLGEITKGEKGYCEPKSLIAIDKENVIGGFHTHPHDKDFFNDTEDIEKQLEFACKITNPDMTESEKEKIRKKTKKYMVYASAGMSPNDLRFSLAHGLTLELIGTTDRKGKPLVLCYELYKDAKQRFQNEVNKLDGKMKEFFLPVFKNWLNNQETDDIFDGFQESIVIFHIYKWIIKEESKINLSGGLGEFLFTTFKYYFSGSHKR